MAGDIKGKYSAPSTAMTVTNLHSLAASQTWIAGWTSASVDNKTSNVDLDYLIGGTFTTHASNRQAGVINIYVISSLNDTPTWPTASSGTPGTEGALAFTAAEQVNACARMLGSIVVNNTASQVYAFPQTSIAQLFGYIPTHWCLYVSHSASTTTTAGLASSGSALYYTRTINQYT
jgi:hypothetical protein